ncbi:hypothetical protein [Pseudonocardia alni]|uniref:hypothetical protein n=1 Tax=Pseudonocardia alni TaxID=33907 RepID=UPI00332500CE
MIARDEPPVLDAYATRDGLLKVWCEHDRRWHTHGRHHRGTGCRHNGFTGSPCTCPVGTGDGHRVEHCTCPGSPYRTTLNGYVLREVGPFTPAVRAAKPRAPRIGSHCPGAECVATRAAEAERLWRFRGGLDVLEASCPKCSAAAGDMCVIGRGKVHSARVTARWRMSR